MKANRFFAPDQKTPSQLGQPWQVGDVFTIVHGPNPRNIFAFRVLKVEPDGSFWKGEGATELVGNPLETFVHELKPFFDGKTTEEVGQLLGGN